MVLRAILKALLMPPLLQLLGVLFAFCWWGSSSAWRRRLARGLMGISLLSLWLLSTPVVSHWLLHSLEVRYPAVTQAELADLHKRLDAIVILGGGRREAAPEFGARDVTSMHALERLRYGAYLHRQTGVPLLVSGGRVFGEAQSEAELMAHELTRHFQVPVRWQEGQSRTTAENAGRSFELLTLALRNSTHNDSLNSPPIADMPHKAIARVVVPRVAAPRTAVPRVAIVTQAWHMPRSVLSYEQAGFDVLAAPTAFSRAPQRPTRWLPSASALADSRTALHEYLGLAVYAALND